MSSARLIAAVGLLVGAAVALALVSASGAMPFLVNVTGFIGALLFALVAVQIFMGGALTPLSEPLPFFAYPFLALTLFGRGCTIGRHKRG